MPSRYQKQPICIARRLRVSLPSSIDCAVVWLVAVDHELIQFLAQRIKGMILAPMPQGRWHGIDDSRTNDRWRWLSCRWLVSRNCDIPNRKQMDDCAFEEGVILVKIDLEHHLGIMNVSWGHIVASRG